MIELDKNSIKSTKLGVIMFCFFAESGAMGRPGTVVFVNKDNEWFEAPYFLNELTLDDICDVFPPLKEFKLSIFGFEDSFPVGWKYLNLGFGNHLIINYRVYRAFVEKLGPEKTPGEIYATWAECAATVLCDPTISQIVPQKVTIVSDLLCYGPAPNPGDEIGQKLTINRKGQVWFSARTFNNYSEWKEIPLHRVRLKMDIQKAVEIIDQLFSWSSNNQLSEFATDVGTWNMTITFSNGFIEKNQGSMYSNKKLCEITNEIRELFPDLNIEAFGFSEESEE